MYSSKDNIYPDDKIIIMLVWNAIHHFAPPHNWQQGEETDDDI